MSPSLPISPSCRLLMRDAMRAQEVLERMEWTARDNHDDKVADRLKSIGIMLTNTVEMYRLGPANPIPAVPAFDIRGES